MAHKCIFMGNLLIGCKRCAVFVGISQQHNLGLNGVQREGGGSGGWGE